MDDRSVAPILSRLSRRGYGDVRSCLGTGSDRSESIPAKAIISASAIIRHRATVLTKTRQLTVPAEEITAIHRGPPVRSMSKY